MINYSIEPIGNNYKLIVWEPAPVTSDRIKPFLFKANYITSSPLEAFGLLKLIQSGNVPLRSTVPGQLAKALRSYHSARELSDSDSHQKVS
ncbi:MAG: hypothetical protein LDL41_22060 [Coleofasciculus sp. S288]|nr:hypothetical protein [Coleofasciculus sp. S288]